MLAGVCAWIVALLGSQVHDALVQHAICAEHGEIVEIAVGASDAPAPDSDEEHEHGCNFELVPLDQVDLVHDVTSTIEPVVLPSVPVLARSQAPRGPPLALAPKTGPPTRS